MICVLQFFPIVLLHIFCCCFLLNFKFFSPSNFLFFFSFYVFLFFTRCCFPLSRENKKTEEAGEWDDNNQVHLYRAHDIADPWVDSIKFRKTPSTASFQFRRPEFPISHTTSTTTTHDDDVFWDFGVTFDRP